MIDLFSQLSDSDKETIENYISYYGAKKEDRLPLKEWLQYWSHSNQLLYKLLGNQFIYKTDFSYKKEKSDLTLEITRELFNMPFKATYHSFYLEYAIKMPDDVKAGFNCLTNLDNFLEDKIEIPIKYKKPGAKKMLQISKGMKPIKALSKIVNYFGDEFKTITEAYEMEFEQFRLKHSMILNDKNIHGVMGFSIHPMDFLTMSDNSSNWSSCMSWRENGCYHVGTVEMMNSNNVLCCYVESKEPFDFTPKDHEKKDNSTWNNKKWRCLAYFNKDIIMSGKAYPYQNENLSKFIITEIKRLAEKNLNRTFAFGPELYRDMIHINTNENMENNRNWMYSNDTKYNIIWDTKGMYNDMLNDSNTKYWCYRNKVKHKKIYNVSGKAPCLCCGEPVPSLSEWDEEYNDRYDNVGTVICSDCYTSYKCDKCGEYRPTTEYCIIEHEDGTTQRVCKKCFDRAIKFCPHCGKPMDIEPKITVGWYLSFAGHHSHDKILKGVALYTTWDVTSNIERYKELIKKNKLYIEPIFLCEDCTALYAKNLFSTKKLISGYNEQVQAYDCLPPVPWSNKYRYINLKPVPFDYKGKIKN